MLETVVGVRSQGELLQDTEDISLPIWKNYKKFHPPSNITISRWKHVNYEWQHWCSG